VLDALEARSAGAKAAFLFGFYDRGREHFLDEAAEERNELRPCPECGSPTTGELCAFCTLRDRASGENVPVHLRVAPTGTGD
jgi:tRNA-5-methyluridine54 2-sulfurtransferase